MEMMIIWAPEAEKMFDLLVDELSEKWGERIARNFVDDVFQKIELLSRFPGMAPRLQGYKNVRRCMINRHISLIYRHNEDAIELISFLINRMDSD